MDLIIPTAGRWNSQPTLARLTACGLNPILVVQAAEADVYRHVYGDRATVWVLPSHITTIAHTRQWILENVGHSEDIVMLDDDLSFYTRRTDDPTKLRDITDDELVQAFASMDNHLHYYAHVGFAAREGANRVTTLHIENTRIMRVLGYNRQTLLGNGVRFDRIELMEDFDVALQLLERGMANLVLNTYAHNQAGSGKAGGCATFRTPQKQAEAAYALAALHPKYVRVVEKTTKGSFGGGTRTDVNIRWKKAYSDSRNLA